MLCALETAKPLLGIEQSDMSQDLLLRAILEASSVAIEDYCRRKFKLQDHTHQNYDCFEGKYLILPNYPIISISNLEINGMPITDYDILPNQGMLRRESGWESGKVTVFYVAGYVLPEDATSQNPKTLPDSLELACILYAQTLLREPNVAMERIGDISVSYASGDGQGLPSAVKALIDPYRSLV